MTIVKLLVAITLATSLAAAQTKLTCTAQCPQQPSESYAIQVGDRPGHAYAIMQEACTWTKPLEIAGLKSKDDTAAAFSEIDGNKGRDHSSRVLNMENGDKGYVRTVGTSTSKDQKLERGQGTWTFAGGAGKLKGLKGSGTYKYAPAGDSLNCEIEGNYTLPSK